ncbi:GTP1/OBG family protein [Prunus dulcis]|uniref:GTP1/OBG family protein n=1 Tax=Prunus dulcis TaxID=3755 RepID=A0A4Y1RDQ5_PRUDU|nr:GTP1/OBG family protein [Prunus dulcis]
MGEILPNFRQKVPVFSEWARHRGDVRNSKGFVSDYGKIRGGSFHIFITEIMENIMKEKNENTLKSQKLQNPNNSLHNVTFKSQKEVTNIDVKTNLNTPYKQATPPAFLSPQGN